MVSIGRYEMALDQVRYDSPEYDDLIDAIDDMQDAIDDKAADRAKEQRRKDRLDKWYVTPL
jgi:wobble nucleotide-excising tRNase